MDWTIEAIIIVFIFACCYEDDEDVALLFVFARKDFPLIFGLIFPSASFFSLHCAVRKKLHFLKRSARGEKRGRKERESESELEEGGGV